MYNKLQKYVSWGLTKICIQIRSLQEQILAERLPGRDGIIFL